MNRRCSFSMLLLSLFSSLSGQPLVSSPDIQENLRELIIRNETFLTGFTGFHLIDLERRQEIFNFRADNYFTPASNVKLITAYLARRILADGAPALIYQDGGDTLDVWGTGYPLLMHPFLAEFDSLGNWLIDRNQPIRLHRPLVPDIPRYGAGWSWDDFNDAYVYEKSPLPLYGNALVVRRSPDQTHLEILPVRFADRLLLRNERRPSSRRPEHDNHFSLYQGLFSRPAFELVRPLATSDELTVSLLSETIGHPVVPGNRAYPAANEPSSQNVASFVQSIPDTVYRRLLMDSDNFLAEQLLLLAATKRFGRPDLELILDYGRDTLLSHLELQPRQWVDGSGLSRYNQFTPRQLTGLLRSIADEWGVEIAKSLLSAGGVNGTLTNYFTGTSKPYLWAKTGSLRNVLCVSGLVETRSGRTLAFSFMHNNFPGRSRYHYREMERTMRWIYENL